MAETSSRYQVQCARIRLKPGSLERVRAWQKELTQREDEVLETLRDEGVWVESVFLEELEGVHYLVYYMKCLDFEKGHEVFSKSIHAIDAYHQEFKKDTWDQEGRSKLECLVDFDRIDEGPAPMKDEG